jgi:hypothetical protein
LLPLRRAERARERQIRAVRQTFADDEPRGRRQRIVLRSEARRELHGVDSEGLLDGARHRGRQRTGQYLEEPGAQQLLLRLRHIALIQSAQLRIRHVGRLAEEHGENIDGGQRRIRVRGEVQVTANGPADRERDAVRLVGAGHVYACLCLYVEEGLDCRRIVEVDGAARHHEPVSLEEDLAVLDIGAAEQLRLVICAAQRQVRAGRNLRERALDDETA